MQLEQIMYQPMQRTLSTEGRNYNSVDLEYLSASVLYCGSSKPFDVGPPMSLRATERGFGIFDSYVPGPPLTRIDFPAIHRMPSMHLQHGKKEYFGRSGEEASDIFAHILVKNTKLKIGRDDEEK